MNAKTEVSPPSAPSTPPARKPRFALFIATACGLGYLPKAPGTWGSLGGLAVAMLPWWLFVVAAQALGGLEVGSWAGGLRGDPFLVSQCAIAIVIAAVGVWSANRASGFWRVKDPARVVVDEVSGQHLTLLLGCALPISKAAEHMWASPLPLGLVAFGRPLNWKYLLLGLILFRVFDIWKPFPVRQAESLPGGWGIMADDWVAAIYAAIGLWIARAAGL